MVRKICNQRLHFLLGLSSLLDPSERTYMPRVCFFTGARTTTGNRITRRGKAKYLGGVGIKTTSVTKRKFKPNLQRVKALVDGKPVRILASTRAIRTGLVVKPIRRKFAYTRKLAVQA